MLVFGHTHKPWVHEYGGVLFVNCGSVGKPKDGDPRGAFAVLSARRRAWRDASSASTTTPSRRARGRRRRAAGRVRRQAPGRGMTGSTPRRLLAEFLGWAFLAAVVIGSGIAAQELSPDDIGLQLLENAAATACGPVRAHPDVRARCRARTSTRSCRWSTPRSAACRWRDGLRLHPGADRRLHRGRDRWPTRCSRSRRSASPDTGVSPRTCSSEVVATPGWCW